MGSLDIVLALGAVLLVSSWLTRRFTAPDSPLHILDLPNERSLHQVPVPRSGGVAILAALALGGAAWYGYAGLPEPALWLAGAVYGLGLVSFVEDRFGLPRRWRLLVQVLAALLVMGPAGLRIEQLALPGTLVPLSPLLAWSGSLLFLLWMTNLYNFMDGMDGFAGGMAVSGFATLAWLGWRGGAPEFAVPALLIAAAAGGFLRWNFPPARIFMGDTGSTALGFLAGGMSLWGDKEGLFPLWAALLAFSPFVVDASFTLLRRLLRGERIWLAHRSHIYQRLVGIGWGHRRTLLRAYLLMAACSLSAVQGVGMHGRDQAWLLFIWALIYGLILLKVRWLERQAARDSEG